MRTCLLSCLASSAEFSKTEAAFISCSADITYARHRFVFSCPLSDSEKRVSCTLVVIMQVARQISPHPPFLSESLWSLDWHTT